MRIQTTPHNTQPHTHTVKNHCEIHSNLLSYTQLNIVNTFTIEYCIYFSKNQFTVENYSRKRIKITVIKAFLLKKKKSQW